MNKETDLSLVAATAFDPKRRILHVPESWQRLISVIRHQTVSGKFLFIDGFHGAGKTTFAQVLRKKMVLVDDLGCYYQALHPLSNAEQILSALNQPEEQLNIVILDDAAEADTKVITELLKIDSHFGAGIFWVILGDPTLLERLPRLQLSRFTLPLFNKEDCHKLISKQLQALDPSIEVPLLESELVYYESHGLPSKMLSLAAKFSDKLVRQNSMTKSFDLANKGKLTTTVVAVGILLFLILLFFRDKPTEETSEIIAQAEQLKTILPESPSEEASSKANLIEDTTIEQELPLEMELSSPEQISTESKEFVKPEEIGIAEPVTTEVTEEASLPIAKIVSPQKAQVNAFADWLAQQSATDFTIQLYSTSDKNEAQKFKEELDLADSYIYPATVKGKTYFRVVWGAYPNRARAQLASKALPPAVLAQKPWLRSFQSIQQEYGEQQ